MKKKILLEEAGNSHLLPSKSLKNKNLSFYKEKIKSNEQRKERKFSQKKDGKY